MKKKQKTVLLGGVALLGALLMASQLKAASDVSPFGVRK